MKKIKKNKNENKNNVSCEVKNNFNLCLICSEHNEISEENKCLGENINSGYTSDSDPDKSYFSDAEFSSTGDSVIWNEIDFGAFPFLHFWTAEGSDEVEGSIALKWHPKGLEFELINEI